MKNKEFTKVYEGLQSLIRVAMGDSVSNDTYFEFKKYFRYPGELLERMEQYGYGSADDYLSAIAALRWAKNRKLDISEMCVGTQLEDFLKKAEEKGKEENDLLLLYSVICYENDATEITGDDLATLLDAAKENTQESVVYFLKKILDDRIHHWNLQGYVDKFLLASKILVLKMDSISSLAQEDVCECADFFMDLMEVSYALKHISEQFSLSIKENMGAASDIILVFSDLYKEPVKKSYEKKLLEAGFSNMDILNLNMGIWYVYERTTELYVSSEIKWWRLAKRWFQSLFLQDKEVPFDGNRLMNLFDKKMPRKIDGEDLAPKFLLAGFAHGIPCVNNSYLLFYILTMYGSYRHSSERVNQLSLWESICTNHPFRIDSEDELEWISFTQMRVHVCTELYRKGCPLEYIEKFMSHLSAEMTGYYIRPRNTVQENLAESTKILKDIVTKEALPIGPTKGLVEKIDEFIKNNNYNIERDIDEICKKLAERIPIRVKTGGVCIKSSRFRECAKDSATNEFYCAYGVCPNICTFYYMADISYRQAKELVENIECNKSRGCIKQAQKSLNMLNTLLNQKLIPQIGQLKDSINKRGASSVIEKHPNMEYLIINLDSVEKEIEKWRLLTL